MQVAEALEQATEEYRSVQKGLWGDEEEEGRVTWRGRVGAACGLEPAASYPEARE